MLSSQHSPNLSLETVRELLREEVVQTVFGEIAKDAELYLNPAGTFVLGGPIADAGLTGRKIIADTYGGFAHHGGGAFSGKDGTKVDRSAAYAARQLALAIVREGKATECEVRLGYAIGKAAPVAAGVSVDMHALGEFRLEFDDSLSQLFTPSAIIERLQLRTPQFLRTAENGHFGSASYSWEMADKHLSAAIAGTVR